MLDIGWPEMLVIAIVLIVVVGPKDLPKMLRTFGRTTSKMRAMAGDFRKQFDEALKEAELDDVKGLVDDARKLNPTADLKKAFDPMRKATEDVRAGLDSALKPAAKPVASPEAAKPGAVAKPAAPAKAGAAAMPGEATASASGNTAAKSAPKKPSTTKPKVAAAKPAAANGKAKVESAAAKPAKSKAVKSKTAAASKTTGTLKSSAESKTK